MVRIMNLYLVLLRSMIPYAEYSKLVLDGKALMLPSLPLCSPPPPFIHMLFERERKIKDQKSGYAKNTSLQLTKCKCAPQSHNIKHFLKYFKNVHPTQIVVVSLQIRADTNCKTIKRTQLSRLYQTV